MAVASALGSVGYVGALWSLPLEAPVQAKVLALQDREQRHVDKLERYDQRAGHEELQHSAPPKKQGYDDR